jgi:sugar lactone lactonase YvrE
MNLSISSLIAAFSVLFLACCAPLPNKPVDRASAPVFYPPLPNPPRIQYLTTLSGEQDLAAPTGKFARFIIGDKKEWRRLVQPYGPALFAGKLYVADSRAPGLAVFDLANREFSLVTGAGGGRMKRPINVSIDSDGTKYVTDTGRNQVLVFDRDERFFAAYGREGQFKPADVAIAGERLYVTDVEHHQVHVLDKRSGRTLFTFGKAGSELGDLFHPTNLAVGPEGDVFVADTGNFRVQRFTAAGEPVRIYGAVGSVSGSFARPKGIAIDRDGRLYVGDAAFENIQLFDADGRLLLYFGQPGEGRAGLSLPAGVALSYESVDAFKPFAAPNFEIEYLILVASQFGPNKVDVFGFGKMAGMEYPLEGQVSFGDR